MNKNSNLLVIDGGTVKTGEQGVVTGLGIVFGSEHEPDQSNEQDFFTSDSFIMKKNTFTVPLYHEHGMGVVKDQIGEATLTKTDQGWEAKAELDLEDESAKQVYEAMKTKQYGFSTGALQHLVVREAKANGTNFLKKWVVGELSVTARPAERKAVVQAIKSLDDGEVVLEQAWQNEPEQKSDLSVEIFDKEGNKIWDSVDATDTKSLESVGAAHSIQIKNSGGSVQYNIFSYDEEKNIGSEVQMYQWGGTESFIDHIRQALDVAEKAVKSDPASESTDFEKRLALLEQAVTKQDQEGVSELKQKLQEQEQELADLKTQLADSENNLANEQERSARLEVLAGAAETINKHKKVNNNE